MRILLVNTFYTPDVKGGAEIILEILAKGMLSHGHDVSVLSLSQTGKWVSENIDGVAITRMPAPNLYVPYTSKSTNKIKRFTWKILDCYNPNALKRINDQLFKRRPDLVLTHNLAGISISAWQACRQSTIPVIHILHDYYLLCPNITMMHGTVPCGHQCTKCNVLRWPHRYLSSHLDAVVGVSRSILKRHEEAGFFMNMKEKHVIYNAANIKTVTPLKNSEQGTFVFGFIGGLTPVKGVDQLIRAFQRIATKKNVKLLIAGKGDDAAYVQSLQLSCRPWPIEFLGYVTSESFYLRIDALVVPSLWHEAFGNVVCEALGRSVPVIGAKRGGIPEIISDGVNGLLYDPNEDANLVEAMHLLMEDRVLFQKLRHHAAASAAHFTDTARMISEYNTLASRVVEIADATRQNN
jgi:glycosyltransferase involved in cell wall biosynthesis